MPIDPENVVVRIFEWAWIAVVAVIVGGYRKVTGLEAQQALLSQNLEHLEQRRQEDKELREDNRGQLMSTIELHNKMVCQKIDAVNARVSSVENLVKNGK